MPETTEVAIIGAGPAGSSAAYETASQGRETILFEEHRQVGRPPHCTGIIWGANYRRAGLKFPESIVQEHPDHVRVFFGLGRSITFSAPGFVIVDRPALDRYLAERATRAGAELRLSNYVGQIGRSDGEWILSVHADGKVQEVHAKVLICADGHGTLLRHIGIAPPKEIISCMQYEVQTTRAERSTMDAYLSPQLAPGGYGWVVSAGDGKAKAGVGVRNSPKPCMNYMQDLMGYGFEDSVNILERYGGIVQTSGVIRPNLLDGFMIVGGAGGYVNPITGAGIVSGYWSGRIAGQIAAQGIARKDVSKEGLSGFRNNSAALLDEPFDKTLALRIAYDKLGTSEFDALYRLIDRFAITRGFSRRRMLMAAIRALARQPSLASFFWRFAQARDALTL